MALEVSSDRAICCRCATAYGRKKGNFPVCYAGMYRGAGYLPFCSTCVDTMYNEYMTQCNDAKQAVRQMCRKLDLYWNEQIFSSVEKKATKRTMMTNYIQRVNNISYAGRSYDDTLIAEGKLWSGMDEPVETKPTETAIQEHDVEEEIDIGEIPEDVIAYWGPGYTPKMYRELEQRRLYWVEHLPEGIVIDIGMNALIRQICNLEIDINRIRAAGKSPDKQIGMLDKLISSMNLKPKQNSGEDAELAETPMGVWLDRYENRRPLPEVDDDLKDVNHILYYVVCWVLGPICKLFGMKNRYAGIYEEALKEFRVEKPEYVGDDDEIAMNDFLEANQDFEITVDDTEEGDGDDG